VLRHNLTPLSGAKLIVITGATRAFLYLHPEAAGARGAAERALGGREDIEITLGPGGFMGGEPGGPIDTVDHGMKFWEKQANALRNTLTSRKVVRLDELRRAAEDLGERYYALQYFERTTHALRTVLIERGLITEAELAAKMAEVRKRYA